jgi:cell division protein FtsB
MIKRLKRWLIERIMPVWAREELMAEIERLKESNRQLAEERDRLNAYIEGLETGIRAQRRIIINNGEVKK